MKNDKHITHIGIYHVSSTAFVISTDYLYRDENAAYLPTRLIM